MRQAGGANRLSTARLHRQPRLVRAWIWAFLIDRQNDRMGGRIDVETNNVLELRRELRVGRQLEGANAMRRQSVRFEDALHRTQAHASRFRQHPTGPVGCIARWRAECQIDHPLHDGGGKRLLAAKSRRSTRTQPGLPMKPGRAGTMTHGYKRHGTTTLFAALNILDGTVIGRNMQRHRHQEFVRFLNTIEAQVPVGKLIHAVVDNYATHKHPRVRRWLARHPRWTFHFTPTSASWLNAVEGFFAKLTRQRLKRGVFQSVVDLQLAINRFVAETNADPKPFVWTADPKSVLAAVKRGKQVLESIH